MPVASDAGEGLTDGSGLHFIINPVSRNCPPDLPGRIRARFPRAELCLTDGPGRAGPIAAGITGRSPGSTVVACGGDGTVREVAGAVGTKAVMGIIPVGTVNQVSRRLGIPGDPEKAMDTIAAGRIAEIYSGLCRFDGAEEEQSFFIGVSAGPDADAVGGVDIALKKRMGGAAYAVSFLKRIAGPVTASITLTPAGGREFRASQAIILADGLYGGSFRFSGDLRLTKPGLTAVWTGGGRSAVVLLFLSSLVSGSLMRNDIPVPEGGIGITLPAPGHFQIDGDPVRAGRAFVRPSLEPVRLIRGNER